MIKTSNYLTRSLYLFDHNNQMKTFQWLHEAVSTVYRFHNHKLFSNFENLCKPVIRPEGRLWSVDANGSCGGEEVEVEQPRGRVDVALVLLQLRARIFVFQFLTKTSQIIFAHLSWNYEKFLMLFQMLSLLQALEMNYSKLVTKFFPFFLGSLKS